MSPFLLRWIALSLQPHIGFKTLRALQQHFGDDLAAVFTADETALRRVNGIGAKIAQSIRQIQLDQVETQLTVWQQSGIRALVYGEAEYPAPFTMLDDPPATIFWQGLWSMPLLTKTVGIVGTRTPTPQSQQWASELGAHLAQAGSTIISGLALGIDGAAHHAAVRVGGGRTIACLGCGMLQIYPPEHTSLAKTIRQQGALVAEVAPDAAVNTPRLVARNRLIAALSQQLIVVQSDEDGGALHAARTMFALQRPVYTFDLPYSGNQWLLQNGARCIVPPLDHFALA